MGLIIRSSGIHGIGCYTTAPIAKGTQVIEYTGPRISIEEGDRRYDGKDVTYLFGVPDKDVLIDGNGMAAFINHGCDPNCETEDDDEGRVWIVALRDIAAGEELSYDYRMYDGPENDHAYCDCGARNCRGTMYSPEEMRRRKRKQGGRKSVRNRRPRKAA